MFTVNTTYMEMTSVLVARTTELHRDVFVARMQRDSKPEEAVEY